MQRTSNECWLVWLGSEQTSQLVWYMDESGPYFCKFSRSGDGPPEVLLIGVIGRSTLHQNITASYSNFEVFDQKISKLNCFIYFNRIDSHL